MIKNIIFDFGGVILTHKNTLIEEILTKMFPSSSSKAIELYLKHKSSLQTGKESSNQFITHLKEELRDDKTIEELLNIWETEYKKAALINKSIMNFIKKLNTTYNVYLFTDTIDIHDKYNSRRRIYNNFKKVFKSFKEGVKKPDKRAYVNLLNKIKANPDECIFIDDLKENVETAEIIGMRGIVYKNTIQLEHELRKVGLKI